MLTGKLTSCFSQRACQNFFANHFPNISLHARIGLFSKIIASYPLSYRLCSILKLPPQEDVTATITTQPTVTTGPNVTKSRNTSRKVVIPPKECSKNRFVRLVFEFGLFLYGDPFNLKYKWENILQADLELISHFSLFCVVFGLFLYLILFAC